MTQSLLFSAHNPMTGPRHLGHYVSSMVDWVRLEKDHELLIAIDDLISIVLYPRARHKAEENALQNAKEFLATGIDPQRSRVFLTSMVPEVHELSMLMGIALDHSWCAELYRETFPALLNAYQRQEIGLPRSASVTEVTYPQMHMACLALGVGSDFFQGGEEMRGYLPIMDALAEAHKNAITFRRPAFMEAQCGFLCGVDGAHMATENAIFLSASEKQIAGRIGECSSAGLLGHIAESIGRGDVARELSLAGDQQPTAKQYKGVAKALDEVLAKFREFDIEPEALIQTLEKSAADVQERVRATLADLKSVLGVPGF